MAITYANPHAVTQLSNGLSTTTYTDDNNGNVIQVGTTTFYTYDYANRLTQSDIRVGSATTTSTYTYGPFGERVSQTAASTTFLYPNKFYSVASSTGTGAKYATTTEYLYAGSNLLATIDQKMVSGTATGTAATRYIHPDNLGSTNVTSDTGMKLIQWFDYGPYGSVIASTNASSTSTSASRQYIGQLTDQSGLNFLNARYYNSGQGQFTKEDPTFLALGSPDQLKQLSQQDQQTFLSDPQQMNSYSYGRDNPITQKDPNGNVVTQAAEVAYHLLYINGGRTAYDSYNSYINGVAENSPNQSHEQSQFLFEAGAFGASTAAILYIGNPVMGAAIDVGVLALSAKDSICSTHTCKDFSGGQKSISEILAGIPTGPMAVPQAKRGSSSGGGSGNGPVTYTAKAQGSNGGGSGGSQSYNAQIAYIQAQIASIQAQINQYKASQSR